ncbi:MAG: putative RDD family membrane protein YckC [Candidatus Latescibacterota bacterium]|jgi:uncharacterized RDD family membrane protein YckC
MENEFKKVMSEHSDEQIIKIITAERDKYNHKAIEAAEHEIEKRNIDTSSFDEIRDHAVRIEQNKQEVEDNLATTSARIINYIIDSVASFGLVFLVLTLIQFIIGDVSPIIFLVLILGSFASYFIILELLFQKTLGKFITKTKVVTLDGQKPNQRDIVFRSGCRFIPFDQVSFLFMKNGFHDVLSKTKVVKDER